jgi:hypothetical protein
MANNEDNSTAVPAKEMYRRLYEARPANSTLDPTAAAKHALSKLVIAGKGIGGRGANWSIHNREAENNG